MSVRTVSRRRGGRGRESSYHRRYKVKRDLLKESDEAWLVEYRREVGGSRNGSYSRTKNATATELTRE